MCRCVGQVVRSCAPTPLARTRCGWRRCWCFVGWLGNPAGSLARHGTARRRCSPGRRFRRQIRCARDAGGLRARNGVERDGDQAGRFAAREAEAQGAAILSVHPVQRGFGGRVRAGDGQLWAGAEALAHRVFADAVGSVEFQGQQAGDGPRLRTLRRLAQLGAADAGHPARGTTRLVEAEVGVLALARKGQSQPLSQRGGAEAALLSKLRKDVEQGR